MKENHCQNQAPNSSQKRKPNKGCFKKGTTPWNKGVTGYMGANSGSFKKGQTPLNTKPIGYERIGKDGYVYVKTEYGFKLKNRLVYEQHHNIKLNRSQKIVFLDQDRTNCDINNLRLVESGALSVANKRKVFNKDNVETRLLVCRLDYISDKKSKTEQPSNTR